MLIHPALLIGLGDQGKRQVAAFGDFLRKEAPGLLGLIEPSFLEEGSFKLISAENCTNENFAEVNLTLERALQVRRSLLLSSTDFETAFEELLSSTVLSAEARARAEQSGWEVESRTGSLLQLYLVGAARDAEFRACAIPLARASKEAIMSTGLQIISSTVLLADLGGCNRSQWPELYLFFEELKDVLASNPAGPEAPINHAFIFEDRQQLGSRNQLFLEKPDPDGIVDIVFRTFLLTDVGQRNPEILNEIFRFQTQSSRSQDEGLITGLGLVSCEVFPALLAMLRSLYLLRDTLRTKLIESESDHADEILKRVLQEQGLSSNDLASEFFGHTFRAIKGADVALMLDPTRLQRTSPEALYNQVVQLENRIVHSEFPRYRVVMNAALDQAQRQLKSAFESGLTLLQNDIETNVRSLSQFARLWEQGWYVSDPIETVVSPEQLLPNQSERRSSLYSNFLTLFENTPSLESSIVHGLLIAGSAAALGVSAPTPIAGFTQLHSSLAIIALSLLFGGSSPLYYWRMQRRLVDASYALVKGLKEIYTQVASDELRYQLFSSQGFYKRVANGSEQSAIALAAILRSAAKSELSGVERRIQDLEPRLAGSVVKRTLFQVAGISIEEYLNKLAPLFDSLAYEQVRFRTKVVQSLASSDGDRDRQIKEATEILSRSYHEKLETTPFATLFQLEAPEARAEIINRVVDWSSPYLAYDAGLGSGSELVMWASPPETRFALESYANMQSLKQYWLNTDDSAFRAVRLSLDIPISALAVVRTVKRAWNSIAQEERQNLEKVWGNRR